MTSAACNGCAAASVAGRASTMAAKTAALQRPTHEGRRDIMFLVSLEWRWTLLDRTRSPR
jgi:hypothetical protein